MQCSFCPTSVFLLTRPMFYFRAAFSCLQETTEWHTTIWEWAPGSLLKILTLCEGGFSALKEQQCSSVPSAPCLSLVITELRICCCTSQGGPCSFTPVIPCKRRGQLHFDGTPSQHCLVKPKHTSWARSWIVSWAWVLSQGGSVHCVQSWLNSTWRFVVCWICFEVMTGFRNKGREEAI